MQKSFPYAINVDWLAVFCHDTNRGLLSVLYNEHSAYEFRLLPHGSRQFKELWHVQTSDGDLYAVIQRVPHSSIISADGAIIQLCNRELYRPHYSSEFTMFLNTHGFKYKSVSRLDVCFDSNYLARKYYHSTLIKQLMQGVVLKNNQTKVQWSFSATGSVAKPMECNSCSFGSKSSSVSTKMYNKTLEMKEVKNKPYIVENWGYNGLDLNRDVWRIEISIKSDASTTVRTSTGEIFRLSVDSLHLQEMVEDIFFSYAQKYFSFKRNNGTKNKTRMPDLEIFPKERSITLHPVRITTEEDSTRGDRIFLKKLHSFLVNEKDMPETTWNAVIEVSNAFSLSRSLSSWRKKKLGEEIYRKGYESAMTKQLHEDVQAMLQRFLEKYPAKAEHIHHLTTLLFMIMKN